MLITWPSLKALALVAVFARNAAAVSNPSTGVIVGPTPYPTAKPEKNHDFKIVFTNGSCSESQQRTTMETLDSIANMVEQTTIWKTDRTGDHDWDQIVEYWFGSSSARQVEWIQSNAPLNHAFHRRATY